MWAGVLDCLDFTSQRNTCLINCGVVGNLIHQLIVKRFVSLLSGDHEIFIRKNVRKIIVTFQIVLDGLPVAAKGALNGFPWGTIVDKCDYFFCDWFLCYIIVIDEHHVFLPSKCWKYYVRHKIKQSNILTHNKIILQNLWENNDLCKMKVNKS